MVEDTSGDGSSYLFRVDTAATPERLLLPAPALEALVFKPVVDDIVQEAKEVLQDALHNDMPANKASAQGLRSWTVSDGVCIVLDSATGGPATRSGGYGPETTSALTPQGVSYSASPGRVPYTHLETHIEPAYD